MEQTPPGAVPIALPFDDEGDVPVPFALTAAARRALDPSAVPALRVVPEPTASDAAPAAVPDAADPTEPQDDLRPAQARALRRSGMRIATIAAAMGVDADLVTAWTADLAPRRAAAARRARDRAAGAGRGDRVRTAPVRPPSAAAGLAVAAARVDADGAAVTLVGDRVELLAAALDALRAAVPLAASAIRVVAGADAGVAADRLHAELAGALGVTADRVVVGRSGGAGAGTDIRVRIGDPEAVHVVDAWAAALTGPAGMSRDGGRARRPAS